jgi:hypothetical protein
VQELKPSVITATIDKENYTCTINYTSGNLTIIPTPPNDLKIRFAYVHSDTTWTTVVNEPNTQSGILSSTIGNMRSRYQELNADKQVKLD